MIFVSLCATFTALSQSIHRAEFALYDIRRDAERGERTSQEQYIEFKPVVGSTSDEYIVMDYEFDMNRAWSDCSVYIHLENIGLAYDLNVNGGRVAVMEDTFTPSDFDISKYVMQGLNRVELILRRSAYEELQEGVKDIERAKFENCYIYSQEKKKIRDFRVELRPHEDDKYGVLDIELIVENLYNYEEPLEVGFDIYDPTGKLLEYSTRRVTVAGKSIDTVRFSPNIYGANKFKWSPSSPSIYKVMLYTKENGMLRNYIPLKMGYGKTEFVDGKLIRFGEPITIKKVTYNAISDKKSAADDLRKLKKSGYNTIAPDYSQPLWFYELCDQIGLYVIDQANINAAANRDNRSVGGTPSNDPSLKDEYLSRVKSMYYRSRNFGCVVAYSLGGDSGNGYNMYKAYEWLKSVETSRPVIYIGAHGEWNSDQVEF